MIRGVATAGEMSRSAASVRSSTLEQVAAIEPGAEIAALARRKVAALGNVGHGLTPLTILTGGGRNPAESYTAKSSPSHLAARRGHARSGLKVAEIE
jgi:hypothetical protein